MKHVEPVNEARGRAIDLAVNVAGGSQKDLAHLINTIFPNEKVAQAMISQWRRRDANMPVLRALQIEVATMGIVKATDFIEDDLFRFRPFSHRARGKKNDNKNERAHREASNNKSKRQINKNNAA